MQRKQWNYFDYIKVTFYFIRVKTIRSGYLVPIHCLKIKIFYLFKSWWVEEFRDCLKAMSLCYLQLFFFFLFWLGAICYCLWSVLIHQVLFQVWRSEPTPILFCVGQLSYPFLAQIHYSKFFSFVHFAHFKPMISILFKTIVSVTSISPQKPKYSSLWANLFMFSFYPHFNKTSRFSVEGEKK